MNMMGGQVSSTMVDLLTTIVGLWYLLVQGALSCPASQDDQCTAMEYGCYQEVLYPGTDKRSWQHSLRGIIQEKGSVENGI